MDFNVIIPIGGLGESFSKEHYDLPKPFIKVKGKEILFWVLESLKKSNIKNIYIPYNKKLKKINFEEEIKKNFPELNFMFLCLDKETDGPSETVNEILNHMSSEDLKKPFFTIDDDTFYNIDIKKLITKPGNGLIYFKDYTQKPIYSYIKFNEEKKLKKIKEKEKISNFANVGIYIFESGNIFQKYYQKLRNLNPKEKTYISKIFDLMLDDDIEINTFEILESKFTCLGSPEQVMEFSFNNKEYEKKRICFDLDNTLVSYPKIAGDYLSCMPIKKNIELLNNLKKEGNYIIIHTARRMKTHNGDVKLVEKDILNLTQNQLKEFGIKYDELVLGKPYANFYIDDKAINAFKDLEKESGFYFKKTGETRAFNEITYIKNNLVKKKSINGSIEGEIHYYKNIPEKIKKYFPKLIESNENSYIIEKVNGLSFSELFVNNLLTKKDLNYLLLTLNKIHKQAAQNTEKINIYENYLNKLTQRYGSFNYSKFDKNLEIYNFLVEKLEAYESNKNGDFSIIHGDPTFTNIIFNKQKEEIKFLDMRGSQGDKLTIYGDKFYDFAKIYHSILGYDFIIKGMEIDEDITKNIKKEFENYIKNEFGKSKLFEVKILTLSLLFSLIPLHEEFKHKNFWKMVLNLFKELS